MDFWRNGNYAVAERLTDFRSEKTVWHASDLLGSAFLLEDRDAASEGARFILEHPEEVPSLVMALAQYVLSGSTEGSPFLRKVEVEWKEQLRLSRRLASAHPNNAVPWLDLALSHTVLGNRTAADRAVRTALSLAPNSRFILRSATRFFIHQEDLERAHNLLIKNQATLGDPWLLSAEIAVASARSRSSRLVPAGRRLAENNAFRHYDRSELAMALASIEHDAGGSRKRIKKFLRQSLIDPTENVVAQADWLTTRDNNLDRVRASSLDVPGAYEASARERFEAGDWPTALSNALDWLQDQPFSARPAIFVTFLASTALDDMEGAIKYGERGVIPNPHEATLLNNLAFCHASAGRTEEARRYLRQVNKDRLRIDEQIVLEATWGLVAFREGRFEEGRSLYAKAIDIASRDKENRQFVEMSILYRAREEILAGTSEMLNSVKLVDDIARRTSSKIAKLVADRILTSRLPSP